MNFENLVGNITNEGINEDTKAVDNLLSQELLQLTLSERAALEEEIHGVHCIAKEETPEVLQDSLRKLAMMLDNDELFPQLEKQAYLRSQSLSFLPRSRPTYINGDEFRLRFLRMTLFDPFQAAKRIVRYLDLACCLFGDHLLERPIRLTDFNKKELQFLRNGSMQFLPFRDRSGRRIFLIMNPSTYDMEENKIFIEQRREEKMQGKNAVTARVAFYMNWVAGEDVDTQRKGLVCIIWFNASFRVIVGGLRSFATMPIRFNEINSVRLAAIHCCVPDTAIHRIVTAVLRLRIGFPQRLKVKDHFGESVELLYKLKSYGIPTEHIPISFSGTIKTGYMKQWTRAREAQESTVYLELANEFRDIIECPQLSDVLFRQGISLIWNPGNARVRKLIEDIQKGQKYTDSNNTVKLKRREMVLNIIQEVSQTSRFLVWNEGGWWNEILDQEQLILKIEYLLKEFRKSKRGERQQHLNLESSTSMFHSNTRR